MSRMLFTLPLLMLFVQESFAQWTPIPAPGGGPIAVVAASGSAVYASTGYYGAAGFLFSTTDDGLQWRKGSSSLDYYIQKLGANDSYAFAGTSYGLYRTSDQGATWALSLAADIRADIFTMDSIVYAGTADGLHRSTDNGSTWSPPLLSGTIAAVVASGSNLQALRGNVLLRSTNWGLTWTELTLPHYPYAIHIEDTVIMVGGGGAGVDVSHDGGDSWTEIRAGLTVLGPSQIDQVYAVDLLGDVYLAGTPHGVYTCLRGDTIWRQTNLRCDVRTIARKGDRYFAGCDGVWTSADSGFSWEPVSNGFPPATVSVLKEAGGAMVAGTPSQALYSDDRGEHWRFAPGLTGRVNFIHEAFSMLYAGTSDGLFRSVNGGVSWVASGTGIPEGQSVSAMDDASGFLFAAVSSSYYSSTIYRSSDLGVSWATADSGLPSPNFIGVLLSDGDVVFAGLENSGIYQTIDHGLHWTPNNAAIRSTNDMARLNGDLFASSYSYSSSGYDLYRSTNHGVSWISIESLPSQVDILELEVIGDRLFIGTGDDGLILSSDRGGSWEYVNVGLPPEAMSIMTITHDSTDLYIGCGEFSGFYGGGGIWRRPISQVITGVEMSPGIEPTSYRLEQNYPNPFNPNTTITYALPVGEFTRLSVFNTLGQEVAVLVNERQAPGLKTVSFDAGNLPSGVYTYRINAGRFIAVKKMLLVK